MICRPDLDSAEVEEAGARAVAESEAVTSPCVPVWCVRIRVGVGVLARVRVCAGRCIFATAYARTHTFTTRRLPKGTHARTHTRTRDYLT